MESKSKSPNPIFLTTCFLNSDNWDTTMYTDLTEQREVTLLEPPPSSSLFPGEDGVAEDTDTA
uniref:Uncharacterized protein n=1 Tax=Arundo donax TaxID=35708 RepID=A0A0A9B7U3_ARUDO